MLTFFTTRLADLRSETAENVKLYTGGSLTAYLDPMAETKPELLLGIL